MASVSLGKILGRKSELRPVLRDLLAGADAVGCIQDADGGVLVGAAPAEPRTPVVYQDQVVGWVSGCQNAAALAALLEYVVDQESEKKSLAGELIERYRELNLLYHLSERMAASPHPGAIASAALEETMRLIQSVSGMILVNQEGESAYHVAAAAGLPYHLISTCCLVDRVIQTGKAELANAVSGEDYFQEAKGKLISLIGAPLKTEKRILGLLLMIGEADRVFTAGELKLLNTIALQVAPAIEIIRLYQIAIEKARIEQELQMARQVQESLLPEGMPQTPGWSFGKRWRPAREVAGDFYDVIEEGDQKLGLVIADVTDKGMPASLFMVFARSALRASIGQSSTPAGAIAYANRLICQDSHEGLFATAFYARLLPGTGEITYVNAGHNPPLLYRAQENELLPLKRTGLPLGIENDSDYDECTVSLAPGDFIVFYTDGITEAVNGLEKEFGFERLKQVIYAHCADSTDEILNALERALDDYVAPVQVFDDVTLMVVKRMA